MCRSSRFLLARFHVVCLLRFVQCLVSTTFGLQSWPARYEVNGYRTRNAVLVYGYGVVTNFQNVVRLGCSPLEDAVSVALRGVCRVYRSCS